MSISLTAAKITSAPGAAFGKPGRQRAGHHERSRIRTRTTRGIQLGPAADAAPNAVLLALQLIGKPWNSDDATFPAPSAVHSCFASTVYPSFRAKARAVRTLSVYPTKAMAECRSSAL